LNQIDKPIITLQVERVSILGKTFARIICKVEAVPLPEETKISIKGKVTRLEKRTISHRVYSKNLCSRKMGALWDFLSQ